MCVPGLFELREVQQLVRPSSRSRSDTNKVWSGKLGKSKFVMKDHEDRYKNYVTISKSIFE